MGKQDFDPDAVRHLLLRYGTAPEPMGKRHAVPFWDRIIRWLIRRIKWF
jgi:hypothetical protein